MKKSLLTWAATLAVVGAMTLPALAGGGGGGGGGGRGGRGGAGGAGGGRAGGAGGAGAGGFGGGAGGAGGFGGGRGGPVDPAAQVTTALQTIQTALNAQPGDEWTALEARIKKVLEDQQKVSAGARNPLQGGRGGGRGGAGMGAGAPAATPDAANPLAVARNDLSQAVATGTTTPDADLKTKLQAVRDNLKKAQDQLTADQDALKKICSVRQEAILVTLGVLN